jgi:hypothetical protein
MKANKELSLIKKLARNLIKAIDENCEEVDDDIREEDTEIIIKQRYIADELEELRYYVTNADNRIRSKNEIK